MKVPAKFLAGLTGSLLLCTVVSGQEPDFQKAEEDLRCSSDRTEQCLYANEIEDLISIPDQPHFLRGFARESDPLRAQQQMIRFYNSDGLIMKSWGKPMIDKSRQGYQMPTGGTNVLRQLTVGSGDESQTATIVYTNHHFRDGMYFYNPEHREINMAEFSVLYRKYEVRWAMNGLSDPQWEQVRALLSWREFSAVEVFVNSMLDEGLKKNLTDYNDRIMLSAMVKEMRKERLNDENYEINSLTPLASNPDLTGRSLQPIPYTRAKDFFPDLILVGPTDFYGGWTNSYALPETEDIVFFNLGGLALQYISGFSLTAHEFVHTNRYLQNILVAYDVEMWAALTTDLTAGPMDFMRHPYLAVVRRFAKDYFGYDTEEALRKIYPQGRMGVIDINEEEFKKHMAEVERIKNALLTWIMNPDGGFLVTFFVDPYFMATLHTKMCDTAAAFWFLGGLEFEPAGIFDPNKKDTEGNVIPAVVQTAEWLRKQEDAGKIKKLAEAALKETGKMTAMGEEIKEEAKDDEMMDVDLCPTDSRFFWANQQEKDVFVKEIHRLRKLLKDNPGDFVARVLLNRYGMKQLTLP